MAHFISQGKAAKNKRSQLCWVRYGAGRLQGQNVTAQKRQGQWDGGSEQSSWTEAESRTMSLPCRAHFLQHQYLLWLHFPCDVCQGGRAEEG